PEPVRDARRLDLDSRRHPVAELERPAGGGPPAAIPSSTPPFGWRCRRLSGARPPLRPPSDQAISHHGLSLSAPDTRPSTAANRGRSTARQVMPTPDRCPV